MVDPVPAESAGRVIPYLMVDGAAAAIDFYVAAFGAEERVRLAMPDGSIGHAEIDVHGAAIFLADAPADMPGPGANPVRLGGSSVMLHQYVPDVDASVERAVAAGATVVRPPEDQFYGDRASLIADPFGHLWAFHTHIRDVTPEEMAAAMEQMA
jgi:PhnB protein